MPQKIWRTHSGSYNTSRHGRFVVRARRKPFPSAVLGFHQMDERLRFIWRLPEYYEKAKGSTRREFTPSLYSASNMCGPAPILRNRHNQDRTYVTVNKDPPIPRTVHDLGRTVGSTTVSGMFGFLGLLMGLFATFALVAAAVDWRDQTAQSHWPLVSALIDRGDVTTWRRAQSDGGGMTWKLNYRVRFDVNGQEQIAPLTAPSATSDVQGAELQSWAARHRRGGHIDVRYDPSRPSRAVFASADVPNAGPRRNSDLVLAMVFAMASAGLLALAKHLTLAESREAAAADTDNPSLGGRIALGVISAAIGFVVIGTAVNAAIHAADAFTTERIIAVPAGLIFVLGGALVALPPGSWRWQSVLSALLITCFAVTFDWVAFGPGERRFGGGVSLGAHVGAGFPVGEFFGRAAFGVAAIVLDIFAIIVWISHCRRLLGPKANSDTSTERDAV